MFEVVVDYYHYLVTEVPYKNTGLSTIYQNMYQNRKQTKFNGMKSYEMKSYEMKYESKQNKLNSFLPLISSLENVG